MGQTLFAGLFQTGCARECYSNCNSEATELVNNGSNINSKFTAIKDTLTTRESKIIGSVVAQLQAFNLMSAIQWCSSQMCHKCLSR